MNDPTKVSELHEDLLHLKKLIDGIFDKVEARQSPEDYPQEKIYEDKAQIVKLINDLLSKMYHVGIANQTAKRRPDEEMQVIEQLKQKIAQLELTRQALHTHSSAALKGLQP